MIRFQLIGMLACFTLPFSAAAGDGRWVTGVEVVTDGENTDVNPILEYSYERFTIDLTGASYTLVETDAFEFDAVIGYGDSEFKAGFETEYGLENFAFGLDSYYNFDNDGVWVTPYVETSTQWGSVGLRASLGLDIISRDWAKAELGATNAAYVTNPFVEVGFEVPIGKRFGLAGNMRGNSFDSNLSGSSKNKDSFVFGLSFGTSF